MFSIVRCFFYAIVVGFSGLKAPVSNAPDSLDDLFMTADYEFNENRAYNLKDDATIEKECAEVFKSIDENNVSALLENVHDKELFYCENTQGLTPLQYATLKNNLTLVSMLLSLGADPDDHSYILKVNALHQAIQTGNQYIVDALLDAGANPNCEDLYKQRPIHKAAELGHRGMVKSLINAGADVKARTFNGYSAYQKAYEARHEKIVKLLSPYRDKHEDLRMAFRAFKKLFFRTPAWLRYL